MGTCFFFLVYLFVVMVSKGGNPPTQLLLRSRVVGGQVIQRRCVMGSSLLPPRLGGCANFVTDNLVWLPCPALLKSPRPETIRHLPSTTCLRTRIDCGDVKRLEAIKETIIQHHKTTFARVLVCKCVRGWTGEKHRGFTSQSATSNKVADI